MIFFRVFVWLLFVLGVSACSAEDRFRVEATQQRLIHGKDNRQEPFEFPDQVWAKEVLSFGAALLPRSQVDGRNSAQVTLASRPFPELVRSFASVELCSDEPFYDQTTSANCSGTLIAPDLLLTAGHCISDTTCSQTAVVFNFAYSASGTLQTMTSDDVYSCKEIVVHALGPKLLDPDYAVIRLDRPALNRTPARLEVRHRPLQEGEALFVAGHPFGLPMKFADDASVLEADPLKDHFLTNTDTHPGNSGSGVFHSRRQTLVGVNVRGPARNFSPDFDAVCHRYAVCDNDGCLKGTGAGVMHIHGILDALCTKEPTLSLCGCGDGACEGRETTANCYLDCGSDCGDGTCNGSESATTCSVDCGTCGNGTCDEDPTTCPSDCDSEGNDCSSAIAIDPVSQVIHGDTSNATESFESECQLLTNRQDRAYAFTITEPTLMSALATASNPFPDQTLEATSGLKPVLSLRESCNDGARELACGPRSLAEAGSADRLVGTLQPGRYLLVVDSYFLGGEYELRLEFDTEATRCPNAQELASLDLDQAEHVVTSPAATENRYRGLCGGSGGNEHVYTFELSEPRPFVAEMTGPDSVLYLQGLCSQALEVACNDDSPEKPNPSGRSRIYVPELPAGLYALFADSYDASDDYTLRFSFCDDFDCCPSDPNKLEPGECGCGEADEDGDGDGVLNCQDGCPTDTAKTNPGLCGCGELDVTDDSDADGTADCVDECPQDPQKTAPGNCGCGIPETQCGNTGGTGGGVDGGTGGTETDNGGLGCSVGARAPISWWVLVMLFGFLFFRSSTAPRVRQRFR